MENHRLDESARLVATPYLPIMPRLVFTEQSML